MSQAALRAATAADADAVARIWREGWRDGHLGHVPAALVEVRTPESFAQRAADRVADTAVAEVDDRARRFYERCGWTDEGAFDYAASTYSGSTPVPCHRYTARTQRLSR